MASVLGRDLEAGQTVMIYIENEEGEYHFESFKLVSLHSQNARYSFWYFEGEDLPLAIRNDLTYIAK